MTDENLVELEIAAFMGPHIKRARIVLAIAGVLYVILGYLDYDRVAMARHALAGWVGPRNDTYDALAHVINLAYAVVIGSIVCGIAMFVLAGIAGRRTMLAFYAAVAIFGADSLLKLYATDALLLTSVLWWSVAIVLTLGFLAARKAETLRRSALPQATLARESIL